MIIRTPRPERFTVVPNGLLEDATLSNGARGLLVYLLSRPDHWRVTYRQLIKASCDGESTVRRQMRELEKAGYLVRRRSSIGYCSMQWSTFVYDAPQKAGDEGPDTYGLGENDPDGPRPGSRPPAPPAEETPHTGRAHRPPPSSRPSPASSCRDESRRENSGRDGSRREESRREDSCRENSCRGISRLNALEQVVKTEGVKTEGVKTEGERTEGERTEGVFAPPVPALAEPPNRPHTQTDPLLKGICSIVGWEPQTLTGAQQAQVAQSAQSLSAAGYTLDDLRRFWRDHWSHDWRYTRKKSRPTLSQLRAEIGRVRADSFLHADLKESDSHVARDRSAGADDDDAVRAELRELAARRAARIAAEDAAAAQAARARAAALDDAAARANRRCPRPDHLVFGAGLQVPGLS